MKILPNKDEWLIGVDEPTYNALINYIGEAAPIVYHEGTRLAIIGEDDTKTAAQRQAASEAAKLGYYAAQANIPIENILVLVIKNEQDAENYLIVTTDDDEEEL